MKTTNGKMKEKQKSNKKESRGKTQKQRAVKRVLDRFGRRIENHSLGKT